MYQLSLIINSFYLDLPINNSKNMKILFTRTALCLFGLGDLLSSCSKRQQSQKTGITYNDKSNGGYERFRQAHPAPGPGVIPIEGGTFVMGGSADQDVTYDYNNVR